MFETVKNRRTIRKYLPKDINPSLLNDLLEISFRASTMGGMQLYSVIVTRDAEMKEKLSPALMLSGETAYGKYPVEAVLRKMNHPL